MRFLRHLLRHLPGKLLVIWDGAPIHRSQPVKDLLGIECRKRLHLERLPGYAPELNPDEHVWQWVRAEVTANVCFGTRAKVRKQVDPFNCTLGARADEVKHRCRTCLQSAAEALGETPR